MFSSLTWHSGAVEPVVAMMAYCVTRAATNSQTGTFGFMSIGMSGFGIVRGIC
jgi:hypothetical protein